MSAVHTEGAVFSSTPEACIKLDVVAGRHLQCSGALVFVCVAVIEVVDL